MTLDAEDWQRLESLIADIGADPCLTIAQAARRMNLSHTTLRKLVADGKLKTVPGLIEKRIKQSTADAFGK